MAATIMQQPEKMGGVAIEIVAKVFRGERVPPECMRGPGHRPFREHPTPSLRSSVSPPA
jgi:hypothetical protein